MAHDHSHNHKHHHTYSNIQLAFALNLSFTLLEIVGGFLTNSVAILSDALHDLGDSFSLGFAAYMEKKSKQKADTQFTFGYQRFNVLGALINSVVLIAGSLFIISEAVTRVMDPEPTHAPGMIAFALLGIGVNGWAVLRLSSGKTVNERVVTWHLLEDVMGWVAVLVVSIVLLFTDWYILDPMASLLITLYVLFNVIKSLKQTLFIFLQGVPGDVPSEQIEARLVALESVKSVHHTHLWTLDGEHHVLSTHVVLEGIEAPADIKRVKESIKEALSEYNFTHLTIETELPDEACAFKPGEL